MTLDVKPLTLADGRTVRCGVDGEGNWLALDDAVARLPRWGGGVGGMELVLSTDQRHLALFIFSGQSSLGYEVFALEPALAHLGGLAEVQGQGTAPVFSPGGRWLASWISTVPRLRGSGDYFETAQDEYSDEQVVVDWSQLFVQRLPEAKIASVAVGVKLPLSTDFELVAEWNTYDALSFSDEDKLNLTLPWGEPLSVALPLTAPITAVLPD